MTRLFRGPTATIGLLIAAQLAPAAPTRIVDEQPVAIVRVATDVVLVDFGRVAFGNLRLAPPAGARAAITVHFGEARRDGRIDRAPPGTVRYARASATLGGSPLVVAPAADARNTTPPAVLTPADYGVLVPFRWVEIEGWPGELRADHVRRRAVFDATWRDDEASFRCSDETLNRIWGLCRYSIKATTFAGVFVDGDRERIAYEADAFLNQLGYDACNPDPRMPRDTFDRLIAFPTWPTEWAPHMVFMAYADWMHTGDRAWLAARYESLKPKLLLERAGPDGLLASTDAQIKRGDIVDWPVGERDGFVFRPVNTVVNAFHLRALALMAEFARAIGRDAEADEFAARERAVRAAFTEKLFDRERGIFRDGEGTGHASLHANLFPLAFGLVPEAGRPRVARWLAERGMACSVYAAQYLLEGLFENGAAEAALALITAPGERSWRHMLDAGTTITWEAWDQRFKPNQDWNHAWGAAPANLLPRFVLGVQPLAPGWSRAAIRPHGGGLASCEGRVPTPRGTIAVKWERGHDARFTLTVDLPAGAAAHVDLPATSESRGIFRDGRAVRAHREGTWWSIDDDVTGRATLEVR